MWAILLLNDLFLSVINKTLMSLRDFIAQMTPIPDQEWNYFLTLLRTRNLKTDEHFMKEGDICTDIGFVQSGLLCSYYLMIDGSESVVKFSLPGNPVGGYVGMILKQPNGYYCKALEPTSLLLLNFNDLQKLYDRHHCWERMGRHVAETLYVQKELREKEFLIDDAKTRYQNFKKQRPDLIEKVPQYLIASFLGMTPVSLSRIKKGE